MAIITGSKSAGGFWMWLRSFGHWTDIGELGVYRYQQNSVTGQRRAIKIARANGVLHRDWLNGGPWIRKRPAPPSPIRSRNADIATSDPIGFGDEVKS